MQSSGWDPLAARLFSVPVGAGMPVRSLGAGALVEPGTIRLTPDGARALHVATSTGPSPELFMQPADASLAPVRLGQDSVTRTP